MGTCQRPELSHWDFNTAVVIVLGDIRENMFIITRQEISSKKQIAKKEPKGNFKTKISDLKIEVIWAY